MPNPTGPSVHRNAPGERVFVSAFRFDDTRQLIVRRALPAISIISLLFAPMVPAWFILASRAGGGYEDTPRLFFTALAFGVIFLPIPGFVLALHLRLDREMNRHAVHVDARGITQNYGPRIRTCRWEDITSLHATELGRIQTATVRYQGGRIKFHADLIDRDNFHPRVRFTWHGEYLQYPNGRIQALRIRENELYQLINRRYSSANSLSSEVNHLIRKHNREHETHS